MEEILLKLKKMFWKPELIFLILSIAFLSGSLTYIPRFSESPAIIWRFIWNMSFGISFLLYFFTAGNKVLYFKLRLVIYIYFSIMMLSYIVIFSIFPEPGVAKWGYIATFIICEAITLTGIYFYWKDYKKEKLLASKCQGRKFKENCSVDMPCIICEEYRNYMSNDEISAAVEKYQYRQVRKLKRKEVLVALKKTFTFSRKSKKE